jgi:ketosteroid isomerase-like protein
VSGGEAYAREIGLWEAYRDRDRDRLEALIHPDAFDIGPAGPLTRDQVIEAVGRMQIDTYEVDAFVERAFGDTAVVTYRATVRGTYSARPFEHSTVYATSVWVRDGGVWRLVHRAETPTGRD